VPKLRSWKRGAVPGMTQWPGYAIMCSSNGRFVAELAFYGKIVTMI
jgi:hypothetical protein